MGPSTLLLYEEMVSTCKAEQASVAEIFQLLGFYMTSPLCKPTQNIRVLFNIF